MNVYVLIVILKWDLERCTKEVSAIHYAVGNRFKRAMHASRNIAFVVTTRETEEELVERLKPFLEVGAVADFWCFVAPRKVVCQNGNMDSLSSYINFAYSEIGKRSNPKNVREIEVRAPFRKFQRPENRVRSAPVQMLPDEPSYWTPPQKSDRRERKQFHRHNPKSRDDDDSF